MWKTLFMAALLLSAMVYGQSGGAAMATSLMSNAKAGMADCADYNLDPIRMEKESEGYWIIQPVSCNGKKVFFVFLMAGEILLLGNIDKE